MATPTEIILAIDRLQRAQPRNADLLLVCEVAQRAVTGSEAVITGTPTESYSESMARQRKAKVDRKTYQRELMRKRRAEGKA